MTFILINVWDLDKIQNNIITADVRCIYLCTDCYCSSVRLIKYFMYQKYGIANRKCTNCGYDENDTHSEKWKKYLSSLGDDNGYSKLK